jgi:hypothetical protein
MAWIKSDFMLLAVLLAGCAEPERYPETPHKPVVLVDGGTARINAHEVPYVEFHAIEAMYIAPSLIMGAAVEDRFEEPKATRVTVKGDEYQNYVTETPAEVSEAIASANGLVRLHKWTVVFVYLNDDGTVQSGQENLLNDPDIEVRPFGREEKARWEWVSKAIAGIRGQHERKASNAD